MDNNNILDKMSKFQLLLLIVIVASTVSVGIILPFLYIVNALAEDTLIEGKKDERLKTISKVICIIHYFSVLLRIPFELLCLIQSMIDKSLYTSLVENNCSDYDTLSSANKYANTFKKLYQINSTTFAITLFILLIDFLMYFVVITLDKSSQKTDPQPTNTNINGKPSTSINTQTYNNVALGSPTGDHPRGFKRPQPLPQTKDPQSSTPNGPPLRAHPEANPVDPFGASQTIPGMAPNSPHFKTAQPADLTPPMNSKFGPN
jgi:hypothetical protein